MFPEDLRYTREHEWARIEGDELTVGVTDYAQEELGDVVYVELPQVGDRIEQMGEFGTVESVKAVSALYVPAAGEVVGINEALQTQPELVNADPYDGGWMVKLRLDDPGQLDDLLNAAAYEKLVDELRA
jgi:glycine cleavage system H protein